MDSENSDFTEISISTLSTFNVNGFLQLRNTAFKIVSMARHVTVDDNLTDELAKLVVRFANSGELQLEEQSWYLGSYQGALAFVLVVDYLNFGSGYFRHLRKDSSGSGYLTFARGLVKYFQSNWPFRPSDLTALEPNDFVTILGQHDPDVQLSYLTSLLAKSANELGSHLDRHYQNDFEFFFASLGPHLETSIEQLCQLNGFKDFYLYDEMAFYPLKKAQITLSDLGLIDQYFREKNALTHPSQLALGNLDLLTCFADNSVPHVLRTHGALRYSAALENRINSGEPLAYGSVAEVEIRAATISVVEKISASTSKLGEKQMPPRSVDAALWSLKHSIQHTDLYQMTKSHKTKSKYY